jgi:hypothetical protein
VAESKDIPQMTYEELRHEHDRVHRVIQGVTNGEPVTIPRDAHAYYGRREELQNEMQARFPERYLQDQARTVDISYVSADVSRYGGSIADPMNEAIGRFNTIPDGQNAQRLGWAAADYLGSYGDRDFGRLPSMERIAQDENLRERFLVGFTQATASVRSEQIDNFPGGPAARELAQDQFGLGERAKSWMDSQAGGVQQQQVIIQQSTLNGVTIDEDSARQARAILEYDKRTPAERENLDARLDTRSSDLVREGVVVGTSAVVVAALEIRAAERAIESIAPTLQAARTGIVEGMNGIEALPSNQHGAARNYYAGKAAGFEEVRSSLESSWPSAGMPARIDVGSEMKTGITAGQERSAGRSVSASFA